MEVSWILTTEFPASVAHHPLEISDKFCPSVHLRVSNSRHLSNIGTNGIANILEPHNEDVGDQHAWVPTQKK